MPLLLFSIILGFIVSLGRAWFSRTQLIGPTLRLEWLAWVAFIPQGLVFYWPATREYFSLTGIATCLVTSQLLFLIFAWANRREPGFGALGLGLLLNFTVISFNGGLMPISPEMASRLVPGTAPELWELGNRFHTSKDIILPINETYFWALSDRFFLTIGSFYRVAFSPGDVVIALGAFWFMSTLSRPHTKKQEIHLEQVTPLAK
jgi:hypothetical protein